MCDPKPVETDLSALKPNDSIELGQSKSAAGTASPPILSLEDGPVQRYSVNLASEDASSHRWVDANDLKASSYRDSLNLSTSAKQNLVQNTVASLLGQPEEGRDSLGADPDKAGLDRNSSRNEPAISAEEFKKMQVADGFTREEEQSISQVNQRQAPASDVNRVSSEESISDEDDIAKLRERHPVAERAAAVVESHDFSNHRVSVSSDEKLEERLNCGFRSFSQFKRLNKLLSKMKSTHRETVKECRKIFLEVLVDIVINIGPSEPQEAPRTMPPNQTQDVLHRQEDQTCFGYQLNHQPQVEDHKSEQDLENREQQNGAVAPTLDFLSLTFQQKIMMQAYWMQRMQALYPMTMHHQYSGSSQPVQRMPPPTFIPAPLTQAQNIYVQPGMQCIGATPHQEECDQQIKVSEPNDFIKQVKPRTNGAKKLSSTKPKAMQNETVPAQAKRQRKMRNRAQSVVQPASRAASLRENEQGSFKQVRQSDTKTQTEQAVSEEGTVQACEQIAPQLLASQSSCSLKNTHKVKVHKLKEEQSASRNTLTKKEVAKKRVQAPGGKSLYEQLEPSNLATKRQKIGFQVQQGSDSIVPVNLSVPTKSSTSSGKIAAVQKVPAYDVAAMSSRRSRTCDVIQIGKKYQMSATADNTDYFVCVDDKNFLDETKLTFYQDKEAVHANLVRKLDDLFGFRSYIFYVNEGVKYGKLACRHKSCPFQHWFKYEMEGNKVVNVTFDRSINQNHSLKAHNVNPEEKDFERYKSILQITSENIVTGSGNDKRHWNN